MRMNGRIPDGLATLGDRASVLCRDTQHALRCQPRPQACRIGPTKDPPIISTGGQNRSDELVVPGPCVSCHLAVADTKLYSMHPSQVHGSSSSLGSVIITASGYSVIRLRAVPEEGLQVLRRTPPLRRALRLCQQIGRSTCARAWSKVVPSHFRHLNL